jgi:hypothetical protein
MGPVEAYLAEGEDVGRGEGEVRGPGRRRVGLLGEEAADLCSGGRGGGDSCHAGGGDRASPADGGEAGGEWESGSDGEGEGRPEQHGGIDRFTRTRRRMAAAPAPPLTCRGQLASVSFLFVSS